MHCLAARVQSLVKLTSPWVRTESAQSISLKYAAPERPKGISVFSFCSPAFLVGAAVSGWLPPWRLTAAACLRMPFPEHGILFVLCIATC